MQGNDDTSAPNDSSEDSGVGVDPIDTKSLVKKPHGARDTDQNPDKV
jgi:hypothetical protein